MDPHRRSAEPAAGSDRAAFAWDRSRREASQPSAVLRSERFIDNLDKSSRCRCRNRNCPMRRSSLAPHVLAVRAWFASERSESASPCLGRFQQQRGLRRPRGGPESMPIPTPNRERSRRRGADQHWSSCRCLRRCAAGSTARHAAVGPERADRCPASCWPLVCPSHIPDRNPVDIEMLMAELHCFFNNDHDNDNDNEPIGCPSR